MIYTIAAALAAVEQQPTTTYAFADYLRDFSKSYPNAAEFAQREAAFSAAMAKIREHNSAEGSSFTMGVSEHTDKLPEEWRKITTGRNAGLAADLAATRRMAAPWFMPRDLPDSVDWRTKGVVSPVKNQGGCGSCWAFSATETIESNVAIATGTLPVLSPQELVDCVQNPKHCGGTGGCEGATQPLGFEYAEGNGMASNEKYPYTGRDGTCEMAASSEVAGIKDYVHLPTNNYTALMHAVATVGPIAISVDAEPWSFYSKGVYDGGLMKKCGTTIDHAVQLVGYGTDDQSGQDYWLVRNSWGESWGEKGYIRVKRFGDGAEPCGMDKRPADGTGCTGGPKEIQVCGLCGIMSDSSYVTGGFLGTRGAQGIVEA